MAYKVAGKAWLLYFLVYVDDGLVIAMGVNFDIAISGTLLFLNVLRFPFAQNKFRGGAQFSWIGYHQPQGGPAGHHHNGTTMYQDLLELGRPPVVLVLSIFLFLALLGLRPTFPHPGNVKLCVHGAFVLAGNYVGQFL